MEKRGRYLNRKAQFYIVAAIIIVGVIISLATITNYAVMKKEPVKFYDLSEELSEESYRTSEYILVNDEDFNKIMEDFTNETSKYIKGDVDGFAVLRGDESGATLEFFSKEETGGVSLTYGSGSIVTVSGEKKIVKGKEEFLSGVNNVIVDLLGNNYELNLKEGQNFIFIITKKEQGETYISTTQEGTGEEAGES